MASKFSVAKTNELIKHGERKDYLDAKEYLMKFFYPLTNGMIYFVNKDKKVMLTQESFKATYGNRIGLLAKYFLKETEQIYDVVVKPREPFINDDELNLFHGFKHEGLLASRVVPLRDLDVGKHCRERGCLEKQGAVRKL